MYKYKSVLKKNVFFLILRICNVQYIIFLKFYKNLKIHLKILSSPLFYELETLNF